MLEDIALIQQSNVRLSRYPTRYCEWAITLADTAESFGSVHAVDCEIDAVFFRDSERERGSYPARLVEFEKKVWREAAEKYAFDILEATTRLKTNFDFDPRDADSSILFWHGVAAYEEPYVWSINNQLMGSGVDVPPLHEAMVEQMGPVLRPVKDATQQGAVETRPSSPELMAALEALGGVQREALLEGGIVPSAATIAKTRNALFAIYSVGVWSCAVYPLPDGEVGIELETPRGSSFVFICETDGRAHCLVGVWGSVEDKHYTVEEVRSALPDEFLRAALGRLPR